MNVGEVWIVDFPFEDDPLQSKRRPCIILNVDTLEVLSIKVTTHAQRDVYDVPIFKWREANLLEPSYARVAKTILLPKDSFMRKCGDLDNKDFNNIMKTFIKYHS